MTALLLLAIDLGVQTVQYSGLWSRSPLAASRAEPRFVRHRLSGSCIMHAERPPRSAPPAPLHAAPGTALFGHGLHAPPPRPSGCFINAAHILPVATAHCARLGNEAPLCDAATSAAPSRRRR